MGERHHREQESLWALVFRIGFSFVSGVLFYPWNDGRVCYGVTRGLRAEDLGIRSKGYFVYCREAHRY